MTKDSLFKIASILLICLFSCKQEKRELEAVLQKPVDYLNESSEDFNNRMEWWRDAKFGMFIHWGPYAVLGGTYKGEKIDGIGEWIMDKAPIPVKEYEQIAAMEFKPFQFDADKWARLMKDAGMKYMVITSKHHDGFALWDSKVSKYDIIDFTTFHRDILKELSEACKKQGIKFGLYYSIMDWHHPQAQGNYYPKYNVKRGETRTNPEFPNYYEEYMKPQLKELIDNYDPEILWFDGEWISDYTHEMGQELYQYLRELKPSIIINNRVDKGRKSMQGMDKDDMDYAGDFGTPEQEILGTASELDWESCMTMNKTWGYKSYDDEWKSTETLVHNLIDAVSKRGNYLLNVGPRPDGIIPEPSVARLNEIGDWLKTNGEAIYGTETLQKNYKEGEYVRYTRQKGANVYYGISLQKPKEKMVLNMVKAEENSKIYLLGNPEPLEWNYSDEIGLVIKVPKSTVKSLDSSYAWVFKINGEERTDI